MIAAFPATGKTFVAGRDHRFVDSDSSRFSWGTPGIRNPNWPANYMRYIRGLLAAGDRPLVSTHAEVRAALGAAGIPYVLVYPRVELRDEYRARMERRGSPPALIRKVIDELWDDALAGCAAESGCEHLILGAGQYLADVLSAEREFSQGSARPQHNETDEGGGMSAGATFTIGPFDIFREGPSAGRGIRYRAVHRESGVFCYGTAQDEEKAADLALSRVREAVDDGAANEAFRAS